ncbi:amino acid ABC transporter permease [Paraburkholderia oxyphila]|uniref:amino acid ABC transporter permease n=1 Tax=Paraburkholderia oxyphila TaxID=614212 RepID=UPI000482093D|nr:amino acid ABC transporter permease [Paraburkholderia oxyphila]
MQSLDFSIVLPYTGLLLQGLAWTLILTALSSLLSLVFGVVFALVVLYAPAFVCYPVRLFIWLFMGTPLLLQLFLIYFGLAQIGIDISAFIAGIIGLSLHFAAYNADVIRAGILSVDHGQTEGARSIGFGRWQTLIHIVIPQAVRKTIPPIGNNMIVLLKDSSLVSVIGITELVNSAQHAISDTFSPFEFYLSIAALYYVCNVAMEFGLRRLEKNVEVTR